MISLYSTRICGPSEPSLPANVKWSESGDEHNVTLSGAASASYRYCGTYMFGEPVSRMAFWVVRRSGSSLPAWPARLVREARLTDHSVKSLPFGVWTTDVKGALFSPPWALDLSTLPKRRVPSFAFWWFNQTLKRALLGVTEPVEVFPEDY
ncbi:hypothetical protein PMIN06_010129 [Paraphaeosphaeria minitans]